MNRMHGIIFAYGKCEKLQTLVEQRVADSIPYAARYRIIDFMLSNLVNAGVTDVGRHPAGQVPEHAGPPGVRQGLGSEPQARRTAPAAVGPQEATPAAPFRGKMEALASVESYVQRIRQEYVVLANGALICNMPHGRRAGRARPLRRGHHLRGARHGPVGEQGHHLSGGRRRRHHGRDQPQRRRPAATAGSGRCTSSSKKLLLELIAECDGHNEYSFHRSGAAGYRKGRLEAARLCV